MMTHIRIRLPRHYSEYRASEILDEIQHGHIPADVNMDVDVDTPVIVEMTYK